ncbi:MAG TPA: phosphopantothenoylcysteine decarboxylase [Chthoniobacteraceae bacterium]|nr:phosphopantothenoylcysteine decarboxylase [Chthoniobacteraceae bacterium]
MTRVVVTCGPSYEPIDEVRRLTNFSTGELGVLLTNALTRAGCEVLCFKGVGATCGRPIDGAHVIPFATNESLVLALEEVVERESVAAVFHAAALADYRVKSVHRADGTEIAARKIPSAGGDVVLTLAPAGKVISQLRQLFPVSRIVGWKYELNGSRADALRAGVRQIDEQRTDVCVVNGDAYGAGFGFVEPGASAVHCTDKAELCNHLVGWLGLALGR